ncbi:hypothetical protein BP5796_12071 [Coleophoma crateriformis]|uniref:Enoyl reductase (ER) domain-containing protein n=1 Tax=Coleophoma crateriformis TaxID=565419 RepID=A0A3D8QBR2_9HELO|nr:hypothetical protein BP5796_12071 [Coleophoma crateriformis]
MTSAAFTRWTLNGQDGVESLTSQQCQLPNELGATDVLVQIHAASLNYRDVVLAKGKFGLVTSPNVVPGSDGAGIVHSVGKSVTTFAPGDKVVTHLVPHALPHVFPTGADVSSGLGQVAQGTIQEYGVFDETALVAMPKNLSFEQAATLTCSGLTAWNALFGGGKKVGKGDTVLTQGTGGVSVAALQFACAAGATVIATTSNDIKAARLSKLGASHVINYRTEPQWGAAAKALTPNGFGVTNVVDVGGLSTLPQSMNAVCVEGVVTLTGILDNESVDPVNIMDCLWRICSVRGIYLGTRDQFAAMVKFIEEHGIEPVLDDRIFGADEVKEAYQYLEAQKHFSKVVIKFV